MCYKYLVMKRTLSNKRFKRTYSQDDIAEKVGVSQDTVSKIIKKSKK